MKISLEDLKILIRQIVQEEIAKTKSIPYSPPLTIEKINYDLDTKKGPMC